MTTHIIGKPPAPKGGATFGDVPDRHVFSMPWRNGMWEMFAKEDGAARPLFGGAERVSAYPDAAFPARILTQPKPRDPEPDPAVTTWRELKPGEWFVWIGNQGATSGLCRKISASTYSEEKRDKACEYIAECDVQSVRPVPASVVVHEEPGARVRVFAAGMATVDLGGNLEVEVDHAELAAIVRQGAALLAQEPASPESGEPEPAELQAGDRIGVVFEGCSDDVHGLRVGIVKRQPAEDRSKPATEEVERWRVKADDLRRLVSAKRIEAERLQGQLAEARAEVQRLRSGIAQLRLDATGWEAPR